MVSLWVVVGLGVFLYVFWAVVKFALGGVLAGGGYRRGPLIVSGFCGFVTSAIGIALAFFPAKQISSVWRYEAKMFGFTLFFLALAAFFFFVYGRLKPPRLETARTT